jgi:hypothetical protein
MNLSTYMLNQKRRPDYYYSMRYMLIDSPNQITAQKRNKIEHELHRHAITRLVHENGRKILKINQEIYNINNELFEFNHEVNRIKIKKFSRRFVRLKPIDQPKKSYVNDTIEKVAEANLNESKSPKLPNISTPILQRRTAIVERELIENMVSPIETSKQTEKFNLATETNADWTDKLFKKRVSLAALPHIQPIMTKLDTPHIIDDWDENLTKIQIEERKRVQEVLKKRRSSFGLVESVPTISEEIKFAHVFPKKKVSKYLWAPIGVKVKQELPKIQQVFRV